MSHDSLIGYCATLAESGIAKDSAFEGILEQMKTLIMKICRLAIVDPISPRMNLVMHPDQIGDLMFSTNTLMDKMEDRPVEVNHPMAENPRVQQIAKKVYSASQNGKPVSKNKMYQFRDDVFQAVIDKYYVEYRGGVHRNMNRELASYTWHPGCRSRGAVPSPPPVPAEMTI